eukprot:302127_1
MFEALVLIWCAGLILYGIYETCIVSTRNHTSNQFKEHENENNEDLYNPTVNILILFCSQIAEELAIDLQHECRNFSFDVEAYDLEDYDVNDLQDETLVIFILSTFWDGKPTDNADYFYQWLHDQIQLNTTKHQVNKPLLKCQANKLLSNLQYAVYGLGDSEYEFYNQTVDEYLHELGGERILEFIDSNYVFDEDIYKGFSDYTQRLLFSIQCKE